jgi:hypothetical protein
VRSALDAALDEFKSVFKTSTAKAA